MEDNLLETLEDLKTMVLSEQFTPEGNKKEKEEIASSIQVILLTHLKQRTTFLLSKLRSLLVCVVTTVGIITANSATLVIASKQFRS